MSELEIKIGRHTYTINKDDRFMDNGSVVMLLTQSKEISSWGHQPDPCLSKKLYKALCKENKKINIDQHKYYAKCTYFNFDI